MVQCVDLGYWIRNVNSFGWEGLRVTSLAVYKTRQDASASRSDGNAPSLRRSDLYIWSKYEHHWYGQVDEFSSHPVKFLGRAKCAILLAVSHICHLQISVGPRK